jgi:hypothetical protein
MSDQEPTPEPITQNPAPTTQNPAPTRRVFKYGDKEFYPGDEYTTERR